MAIDILRNCPSSRLMTKDTRVLLVTTSEKWKAQDYGLQDQDYLCASKQDISKELRSRGGAKFVLGELFLLSSPAATFSNPSRYADLLALE